MAYTDLSYPASLDFFQEVVDGTGPTSLITAALLNKVQSAVRAVELRTQYTPTTPQATGSIIYVAKRSYVLAQDLADPGLRLAINITLDSAISTQYFQGSPFNRKFPVFASCVGYKIVNGARVYFPVRSAVNVVQENGNLTAQINNVKDDKWRKNHVAEITVMVVNPGFSDCPVAVPPPGPDDPLTLLLAYKFEDSPSPAIIDNSGTYGAAGDLTQGDICEA